jgi:acetylornithine deacetylase/succinyl-diaminopimelate desuccinylase-like protein
LPASPTSAVWESYLAEREAAAREELIGLLRIPSVSTAPERTQDVHHAAEWVVERLTQAGVPEVGYFPSSGHPVIQGRWHVGDDRPTVLVYGHYDVQPAEPLDLWESPPFEPAVRDGKLYARGAADMKGNLLATIQAIEALAHENGAPPVNVIFLFEGEEEIGSPNLPAVVAAHRDQLACDVVLSADGGMKGPETPSLTIALKGVAACQVDLRTGSTDLHSGGFGAFSPNAVQAMAQLAATFHTPEGAVAVAGFYDQVRELTTEDRAEIAAAGITDAQLQQLAGVQALWGESGYSAVERQGARPTLDLNGIWGGFQGEGVKTVTPCQAHLKITCRLVADQDPATILDLIEQHVARHCPPGATATVIRLSASAKPFLLRRDDPALTTAKRVLRDLYRADPLIVRSGGSVPITEVFQRELGRDTVTIGWGMPNSRAHAPNEWVGVNDFALARRGYAAFFAALAE